MMKRFCAFSLLVAVVVGILGCTALPAKANSWQADNGDYSGWTISGDSITGVYAKMNSHTIYRECIPDLRNFRLEMDISSDNVSSPYIRLMGMEMELDANNGDGNNVFIKLNGAMLDWYGAQGTKIHLTIERERGGDLQITLQGEGNETPMKLTAPALAASAVVQIGMYRGGTLQIRGFSCVATGDGTDSGPAVDSNGLVIPLTVGKHFDTQGTWQTGPDGLTLRSSSVDASARAVYMTEKLSDTWFVKTDMTVSTGKAGLVFLDRNGNAKMRLMLKAGKLTWELAQESSWKTLWEGQTDAQDVTVLLSRESDNRVSLTVSAGQYYTSVPQEVSAQTLKELSRVAFTAEKAELAVSGFTLGSRKEARDYDALAAQTYRNLMKNYLDEANNRLYPVRWGFINGTVTNTGRTVRISDVGEFWESVVMLMALDTYAQTLSKDSDAYLAVCRIIANTVNMIVDGYPHKQLVTPVNAPNYAMDDCSWNVFGLYLGYHYNKELGNHDRANTCLRLAKSLFNNSYDTYYNATLGGGLAYRESRTDVSLYGATMALAGYYIHQASGDAQVKERYLNIYNGMEKVLRRPDGLYWCGVTATGADGIGNPYGIGEAGSCTYINGNFAMAILNTLLGEEEKAEQTVLGILRYETYDNGAYMNDRDAWNNTFFLGMFVREVLAKGIAQEEGQRALEGCVRLVLKNCVFADGYYSACWSGPQEPESRGWPSIGEYKVDYSLDGRNPWGKGYNNDGLNIGSTPNQIMTSATTAHVLMAAALSDTLGLRGTDSVPELMGPDSTDPTQPPETEPSEPETEPSEPETEPSEPETEPSEPETEPTQAQTQPSHEPTQPTQPQTQPSAPSVTHPEQTQPQPSTPSTQKDAFPMWMLPVIVVAVGIVVITAALLWKPRKL